MDRRFSDTQELVCIFVAQAKPRALNYVAPTGPTGAGGPLICYCMHMYLQRGSVKDRRADGQTGGQRIQSRIPGIQRWGGSRGTDLVLSRCLSVRVLLVHRRLVRALHVKKMGPISVRFV